MFALEAKNIAQNLLIGGLDTKIEDQSNRLASGRVSVDDDTDGIASCTATSSSHTSRVAFLKAHLAEIRDTVSGYGADLDSIKIG